MKKLLILLAGITLLTSCGHISGGVAPSNIPLTPGAYKELGEVQGTDCVYYLLGLIPLRGGNQTKDALKDALLQTPSTYALVNVTADTFSQYFFVVSRICTQVHGTAVALK